MASLELTMNPATSADSAIPIFTAFPPFPLYVRMHALHVAPTVHIGVVP
jgi:hypothetical protein